MANGGSSSNSNAPKPRKRVEAQSDPISTATTSLMRARNGSAFARCEECNKDVPVVLISMHSCSLDAKIKMNLEAQVIEMPAEVKKKPAERKKPTSTEPTPKRLKGKSNSDPNKPKRPATSFFLFMDDFRKEYKKAHPDSKNVKEVAKEGGEKWKNMTEEEKKPYLDKAAELKAEYTKALEGNGVENEAEDEDETEDEVKGEDETEDEVKGEAETEAETEVYNEAEKEDGVELGSEKDVQEEEEVLDDY